MRIRQGSPGHRTQRDSALPAPTVLLGPLFLLATIPALTGCGGPAAQICEERGSCEGLSDDQIDQCESQLLLQGDQAAVVDCENEHDAFLRCISKNDACAEGEWSYGESCDEEEAAYLSCIGVDPGDDDSAGDDDTTGCLPTYDITGTWNSRYRCKKPDETCVTPNGWETLEITRIDDTRFRFVITASWDDADVGDAEEGVMCDTTYRWGDAEAIPTDFGVMAFKSATEYTDEWVSIGPSGDPKMHCIATGALDPAEPEEPPSCEEFVPSLP